MKLKPVKEKVASLVAESDKRIVNDRIAKREEVLEMLTRLMQEGQPSDTAKIRAAELLGSVSCGERFREVEPFSQTLKAPSHMFFP